MEYRGPCSSYCTTLQFLTSASSKFIDLFCYFTALRYSFASWHTKLKGQSDQWSKSADSVGGWWDMMIPKSQTEHRLQPHCHVANFLSRVDTRLTKICQLKDSNFLSKFNIGTYSCRFGIRPLGTKPCLLTSPDLRVDAMTLTNRERPISPKIHKGFRCLTDERYRPELDN